MVDLAVSDTVPGERWTFGVDPLPQTRRTAALLREVTGLVIAFEEEDPAVDRLIAELERAKADLALRAPMDATPRVGASVSGDGRVYVDHAFDIGSYNPCFPEYAIEVNGDRARGSVTFPLPYEGPPGLVHGGFLALFFDCAVQQHNCEVGVAGKTTSLSLRYRRPTSLLTALTFTLERTSMGDRIHSSGSLSAGDTVLCEAEVDAIAGVRSDLPDVSPRRKDPE
jgi:hypothetical protein